MLCGIATPAVLFEVGFIVDQEDEQFVRGNYERIATQVVRALKVYSKQVGNLGW